MQTEVTDAGPFERLLTVHIAEPELEKAKDKAARKLSREMKIKGFRPGKAPRAVVERMVGEAALRSEAIDEALPQVVGTAIEEADLNPVTTPRLEAVRDHDEGGVELEVKITLWPTVEAVPEYSGRKVAVEIPEVEQQEIDDQIDRFRNQYAELEPVEREGDRGDFVMVNITALAGGQPVEDASADDLLYEIGSQSFIPGLDDLLMGVSAGDIREGPAMLPPGFGDHAGAEVTLRVLVKEVRGKKLPDVTDEWVSDVSEFETVDELVDALRENLGAMKRSYAASAFQDQLLEELTEELDLELPEALVEAEMEASLHNMAHSLEQQGIDLANYLRITGQDQEQFAEELRGGATRSLRTRVLLESVARIEGLEVDDDETSEAIASLAQQAGRPAEEVAATLAASGQDQVLTGDILRRKALDRLLQEATAIDADGNPVDLNPPAADGTPSEEEDDEREAADAADEVEAAAASEPENVEESDAITEEEE